MPVEKSTKAKEGSVKEGKISLTFVGDGGEEKAIKVPVGMSMLEAAHENDIELEGAFEESLACSTYHVIMMGYRVLHKLEDLNDEKNDMLYLTFGLTEISRLVIASPKLDELRLALSAATHIFSIDGYILKPH
ncbi:adrenodoxin-like protein 2, mitochondrial [Apium graveolens]|uniref:adrenodoxin-like protein 2, mitochondrial n=1 Tax=Apium graveolens TaxID=4045 RepID=UPI003D7AA13F